MASISGAIMARSRAPPSISPSTPSSSVPATSGDRVRTTTPTTRTARARISREIHRAPAQHITEWGDAQHDAQQRVDGHERGPRCGDRPGVEGVLEEEHGTQTGHGQHVGLDMDEDVAPA